VSPCPEDACASTPERARLHRPDARQPRSWALTPHPTHANLPPRANLDVQGGLDFLSVGHLNPKRCHQIPIPRICSSPALLFNRIV
jgi:hypothetical protein